MTDKPSTEDTAKQEPPEFAAFLVKQGKGSTHRELSERLQEIVLAVQATGKQGKLSYTVTIKPIGSKHHGDDNQMVKVIDEIKSAIPRAERPESMFWLDDNGGLSRNPINQPSLYDEATEGTTAR